MELFYQSHGSGFPLIVLHGLFGSSDNWQPVAKRLGVQFEVLAVDLRNHGRSPHSEEMSYAVMAEDVREFMAQRGFPQAHVLGHSLGGKVAMEFALRGGRNERRYSSVRIRRETAGRRRHRHTYAFAMGRSYKSRAIGPRCEGR